MSAPVIALDATYSLGRDLSGVGVYSRELLRALAKPGIDPDCEPDCESDFEHTWKWLYRPHRFLKSWEEHVPANVSRGLLLERPPFRSAALFHGLNQRLPFKRFKRQVVTFHDLFVMTADYSTRDFQTRFTAQARHAAAQADHIIAVSAFTAQQVTGLLGVESSRISVVPHGVRAIKLPDLPRELVILHVGAIQKRKNLVRLVHAFEALPANWKLVLAGSDGYAAAETHAAINASPARDRVLVTGYIRETELAMWYARASIFAFPSLDEGFGMPVLEAMKAGVPVLASGTSALGEIMGNAAIRIDPRDQHQITHELCNLAQNSELRQRLTIAGYAHATTFTWDCTAAATRRIYRKLIPRP